MGFGGEASQNKFMENSSHHEYVQLQAENLFLIDTYSKLSIMKN